MKHLSFALVISLLLVAPLEVTIAEDAQKTTAPSKVGAQGLAIGLGVGYRDKPYKDYDSDDKVGALPIAYYEGSHFFLRGQSIGWDFMGDSPLEVAIVGELFADGYDSGDSDFLDGMSDRDPSFGVGGHILYRPENLGVKFVALTDVTDNSEGSQMRGEVFYVYRSGHGFQVVPSVGIVWQDEDYNDYYYGVRNREATAARPAYSADEDISYRTDLGIFYSKPGSRWVYSAGFRYEFYGDEVDDSPITDDDTVFSAFGGIAYAFF